jgi:MFS family permease
MCILFAVLALVASIIGAFLFGIAGGCATAVFAILAIVFAVKKKKSEEGGGTGSIVISIISLVLGFCITMLFVGVSSSVKEQAKKVDAPLVEKYADDLKFGVLGFVFAASNDGVDVNDLTKEFERVSDSY